jgi:hypothetical protein
VPDRFRGRARQHEPVKCIGLCLQGRFHIDQNVGGGKRHMGFADNLAAMFYEIPGKEYFGVMADMHSL